jgi:recombinational DNA repair protein (RecF pathway)
MHEYVTKAVVLDKTTRGGEADARYSFFTERYGKIAARATSSRKIVSKLAGHLEPGTLTSVRIIEQRGTKVVDALKVARIKIPMRSLAALNQLLGEWEPDGEMWDLLNRQKFSWARALAVLGWDPQGAVCANCGAGATGSSGANSAANSPARPARYFYIPRQEFFCAQCAVPLGNAARYSKSIHNHLILV